MNKLTDKELIEQLKQRLEDSSASQEVKQLMLQLEQVNRKLRESEALKGQFLSNIRNEILNPFAAILGLSESILMSDPDNWTHIQQMAQMIQAEALNLDFQLKNIFMAAEVEAGEVIPRISRVDIEALLMTVTDYFSNSVEKKRLILDISAAPAGEVSGAHHARRLQFKTDSEKLFLIVANLLSNAIEYSYEGNHIIIRVGVVDEKKLVISVQDFGMGIEPHLQEIMFERFKQGEAGSTKSHRGHGLGLSVVKALVSLLGGTVEVKSAKNQGSIFTITLPESNIELTTDLAGESELFLDTEELF